MDQPETDRRPATEQGSRALVACGRGATGRPVAGGRPMAGFLTQLIVGSDPRLRPARSERMRGAAALYARTAGRA